MVEDSKIKRYLIIGFLFFLAAFILNTIAEIRQANYQFKGVIQKIDYNEKKIPSVTINGKEYGLMTNWRFNEKMGIGDSLIKEKNSMIYKLIKYKTGKVIFSK